MSHSVLDKARGNKCIIRRGISRLSLWCFSSIEVANFHNDLRLWLCYWVISLGKYGSKLPYVTPSLSKPTNLQRAARAISKMASSSSSHLPASVFNPRRHVGVHAERVSDVASTEFPGHYPGEDHSWSLAKFKEVRAWTLASSTLRGCADTRIMSTEPESLREEAVSTFR